MGGRAGFVAPVLLKRARGLIDLCLDYSLFMNCSRNSVFYTTRNMTDKLLLIASLQIVLMNLKKIVGEVRDHEGDGKQSISFLGFLK